MGGKIIIMGIGNRLRKDDGIGPFIIEKLRKKIKEKILIDAGETPENYLEFIISKKPEELIIIDAADFGEIPGKWRVFTEEDIRREKIRSFSTHSIPLSLWIELLKRELPNLKVKLIGIQPQETDFGEGISDILKKKVKEVIKYIQKY